MEFTAKIKNNFIKIPEEIVDILDIKEGDEIIINLLKKAQNSHCQYDKYVYCLCNASLLAFSKLSASLASARSLHI